MGGTRFNKLQKALSLASSTLLSKRLDSLVEHSLVLKKKIPAQKGYEYFATDSCKELLPVIVSLGEWGMRWARSNLTEKADAVELLMLSIKRTVIADKCVGDDTVIRFKFTDIKECPDGWLIVSSNELDLCTKAPGKDVDVYFTTAVQMLAETWKGRGRYRKAQSRDDIKIIGDKYLVQNVMSRMGSSIFSGLPPASQI